MLYVQPLIGIDGTSTVAEVVSAAPLYVYPQTLVIGTATVTGQFVSAAPL